MVLSLNLKKKNPFILWGCLLFLLALLNGCSTTSRRDGPPPYPIDESKVPNATPKKEPLAKYGNMPKYRVFGKTYYVMKSSKNYHEKGTASWYGMKFHKQRTSSGEPYDVSSMTAAHRTLPLPTYVEVTNLANNKKVIVKVNDRGPFASNRILDLSYVAAKKLGMVGHGTAHVEVRAITPGEAYKQPTLFAAKKQQRNIAPLFAMNDQEPASSARKPVYLQVGAFKNRQYAENLRKKILAFSKASPVHITHTASAAPSLYRVKIGPIQTMAEADHLTQKLRDIGLEPRHG